MRGDSPSTTAAAVALARAVATLPAAHPAPAPDPIAARLLHPRLGRILDRLTPLAARTPLVSWALRLSSFGLVDHLALRTAAIDAALRDVRLSGVSQVVILGAGLDGRAWRIAELEGCTVFEVDHPATQRFKRSRVEDLAPCASEVRFVAVDFTREDLGVRLAEEGHDTGAPTFWIWEGVVPYLPEEATRATLHVLADRSAEGSTLAVTYGLLDDRFWLERLTGTVHLAFRILGEPLHGLTTRDAFHALLAEAGWNIAEDTGPHDWRERHGYGMRWLLTIVERLTLAVR